MTTKKQQRPGRRVKCVNDQPSMTQQNMRDECNINNIMARYQKTGVVTHLNNQEAKYGDFTNLPDYQGALNLVIYAEDLFRSIPAKIRKEFDNDPLKFIEFAQNPENNDKLVEMGLKDAPQVSQETKMAHAVANAIKSTATPTQSTGEVINNDDKKSKLNDEK